jgi:protein gp37
VFPSLCDWLEDRPDLVEPRGRFLGMIDRTPCIDWLLLTKRVVNWRRLMQQVATLYRGSDAERIASAWLDGSPPPNVWFGVSVEDQENADVRIPHLLEVPAAVRWVSYEPALGPIDFAPWLESAWTSGPDPDDRGFTVPALDWIVVGGESKQGGREARPFRLEWARETVRQGAEAGVPIFVKQLGSTAVDRGATGDVHLNLVNRAGADMEEWPADLRVREFPEAATTAA